MASLFNTKISDTYVGLIKTLDTTAITATLKELSDGNGNSTGLFINTSGDFKVTAILEWGSLKDTGTGIIITNFVDSTATLASNKNDTTIPTSKAVSDYVDTQVGASDLDFSGDSGTGAVILASQTFAVTGTTNQIETTASGTGLALSLPSTVHRDLQGNVTGNLTGDVTGNVTGNVTGDLTGNSAGTHTGAVVGNVTGDVTGDLTGIVTATSSLADGVTATSQALADDSTKVATTAFVQDVVGTIPAGLVFQGTWNASTNTPTLASGTGTTGHFYIVSVAGTTDLDGVTDWAVGDWAVFVEQGATDQWEKVDNSSVLDGNGTGGKISKWSGSGNSVTLTDSVITESGSNIGIGTSSPDRNLVVNDASDARIKLQENSVDAMQMQVTSGQARLHAIGSSTPLSFWSNGSQRMNISTAGALQFNNYGAGTLVSDASGNITSISGGGEGGPYLPLAGGTLTGNLLFNDNVKAKFGTGSDLEIYHDGSNSYINDTGTGSLITQTSAYFLRQGGTNNTNNAIVANTSVDLYYDNAKKFETTSSGVEVSGAVNAENANLTGALNIDNTLPTIKLTDTDTSAYARIRASNGKLLFEADESNTQADTNIRFDIDASEKMRITSDGEVKIINSNFTCFNTSSTTAGPTLKFDAAAKTTWDVGDIIGEVDFFTSDTSGNAPYSAGFIQVQNDTNAGTLPSGRLVFGTASYNSASGAVERMRIDSSGRVGIGTDNPNEKFSVDAATANSIARFASTTDTAQIIIKDDDTTMYFGAKNSVGYISPTGSTPANGICVDTNGEVGIGTATPTKKLDVQVGTTNDDGIAVKDENGDIKIDLTLAGTTGVREGRIQLLDDEGNTNVRIHSDSTSYFNGGSVGIGTAAPAELLNVNKENAESVVLISRGGNNVSTSTDIGKIKFSADYDGSIVEYGNIKTYSNSLSAVRSSMDFNVKSTAGNIITGMTVYGTSSDVNLGIGTSSPSAKINIANSTNQNGGTIENSSASFDQTGLLVNNTSSTSGELFRLRSSGSNKFIVSGSGNVGINDTSSGSVASNYSPKLLVGGSIVARSLTSSASMISIGGDATSAFISAGKQDGSLTSRPLRIEVGSTEAMRIDSSGAVQVRNSSVPTIQLYNTDTSLGTDQTLGDLDWYQSDPSGDGVGIVAKIRGINSSSFQGEAGLAFHTGTPTGLAERMRIDSAGELQLTQSNAEFDFTSSSSSGYKTTFNMDDTGLDIGHNSSGRALNLQTNSTDRLTITGSGQVGIGTTSPSVKLAVEENVNSSASILVNNPNTGTGARANLILTSDSARIDMYATSAAYNGVASWADAGVINTSSATSGGLILNSQSGGIKFQYATAEKMRIDSAGNVLIGTTGTPNGTSVYGSGFINDSNDANILIMASSTSSAKTLIAFRNPNGTVGSIQTNASATSYVTSSDYRLKENVVEMTGALDRVAQLKPSRFNFISDSDTTVDGFLAHEVQSVVPEAITGTKDGMKDEEYEKTPAVYDGDELVTEAVMDTRSVPDYQGIDQSKLVPLLVGAIQELQARIEVLESK